MRPRTSSQMVPAITLSRKNAPKPGQIAALAPSWKSHYHAGLRTGFAKTLGFPQVFPQVWKTFRGRSLGGRLATLPQPPDRDNAGTKRIDTSFRRSLRSRFPRAF